jgi:hypothetical protein
MVTRPRKEIENTMRFYEIVKFSYSGHWIIDLVDDTYRGDITYSLKQGTRLSAPPAPFQLVLFQQGIPMDFSTTLMGIPVVTTRGAALLRKIASNDVQLIPARLRGHADALWVVNITKMLNCVDVDRSRIIYVEAPGGGALSTPLYTIDPVKVGESQIFRLANDYPRMIISETLKCAIIDGGLIGPGLASVEESPEEIMPGLGESDEDDCGAG